MKIVINADFGGFGLSEAAVKRLGELGLATMYEWQIPRNDERLVRVVEELGTAASGDLSSLKVVEIPDGVDWVIEDYDGREWVSEKHRTWE